MQKIFEEYGQTILVFIVAVALLGCIFGGAYFFKTMNEEMNVNADISYSKSDEALESFSNRTKPTIAVLSTDLLHLHTNETFKPIASVSCTDAEGNTLVPTVLSIMFIDGNDGSKTEFIGDYNITADEFDVSSVIGKTGTLAVTYKAADSHNVITKKTISYVIDVSLS